MPTVPARPQTPKPPRFAGCPCSGKNLSKLVQPSLLALLANGPSHGYALTESLAGQFAGWSSPPRHPAVYRLLRQMEAKRLVRSESAVSGKGPPRTLYTITEEGRACLERWIESLEAYGRAIQTFLRVAHP